MGRAAHVPDTREIHNRLRPPSRLLMTDDNPIFAEIAALLDGGSSPALHELENTLTSGYAAALQLEAERWRIERRIAEVGSLLGDGQGRGKARELAKLARRLTAADAELARLRGILGTLRSRTEAARL